MLLFSALLALLMLLVFWFDATQYIIPNWLAGLVLALWPVMLLLTPQPVEWLDHLLVMLGTFVVGFGLYALRWMGGGDIKLLTACALWAGTKAIVPLIFWTALLGGALSVLLLIVRPMVQAYADKLPRMLHMKAPLPYGLAIAGAFLFLLWKQAVPGIGGFSSL